VDYQVLLYNPIYLVLGVPAVIHMGTPLGDIEVTVVDKTVGVTLNQGPDLQTEVPAAAVRAAEIVAAGIQLDELDGKLLRMNGVDWRISSLYRKPSPLGESDGEIYLLLDGGLG
jgi:hypothetical protein